MVLYTCENCLKEFTKKSNYLQHIENKKKPCEVKIKKTEKILDIPINFEILKNIPKNSEIVENNSNFNIINTEINNNICKYCLKNFSTTFNLNKHLKNSCKVKKLNEEKKEDIFNKLIEKEEKM